MTEIEDRLHETLNEWEEARQEENRIRGQYMATGPLRPGEKMRSPEKILNANGFREIEEAQRKTQEKWDAHQEVIEQLRGLSP